MINETLKQLGFGEKEIRVYLAVLQYGKITPASLAKIVGLNRTTIYSISKDLVQQGVIAEDLGGKSIYLVALPPQNLETIINRQEKELQNKKITVKNAIDELLSITKTTKYSVPKITFIQERDLEDYLYKKSDEWHQSILLYDAIYWGFQDHTFAENYEKWIDWEWQKGAPKNLFLRLFSNKSKIEEKNKNKHYNRRVIKYWSGKEEFTATVWVMGDYLTLIQTRQRPHYLVEINDQLLAHNMREFFRGMWEKQS